MSIENQLGVVATIQAKEGQEETLLRALQQVAISTVQEPGCKRFELYRDPDSPSTFIILERWADDEAFKSHMSMPHTKTFYEAARNALAGTSAKKLRPVGP